MKTKFVSQERRAALRLGLILFVLAIARPSLAEGESQYLLCNLWDENFEREGDGADVQLIAIGSVAKSYAEQLKRLPFRYSTQSANSIAELQLIMPTPHLLFIAADMGNERDRKRAHALARWATEKGILTVTAALGCKPQSLPSNQGTHIQIPPCQALDTLCRTTSGIAQIINVQGHVGLDFEDIRTVLMQNGVGHVCSVTEGGMNRAHNAAVKAVQALEDQCLPVLEASAVLVIVSATEGSLRFKESKIAMNTIREALGPAVHLIYGTYFDNTLGGQIQITLLATGLPTVTS